MAYRNVYFYTYSGTRRRNVRTIAIMPVIICSAITIVPVIVVMTVVSAIIVVPAIVVAVIVLTMSLIPVSVLRI